MCRAKHQTQKLGHHILRYVSKFQDFKSDNSFVTGKHIAKTFWTDQYCAQHFEVAMFFDNNSGIIPPTTLKFYQNVDIWHPNVMYDIWDKA